jgi:hypothetical protein
MQAEMQEVLLRKRQQQLTAAGDALTKGGVAQA